MLWRSSTRTIRRNTLGRSAFILLLVLLNGVARADSDGYYCVGNGYVAFQLRSALTAGVAAPQVIRVVRFGAAGLRMAGEVALPDFQPHKLVCGKTQVRIGGWMGRPVEYVIDVDGDQPRLAFEVSNPSQALQGSAMSNLGAWAEPGSVSLSSDDRTHRYRLVTSTRSENVRGGLRHHVRSVIEMVAGGGAVVQQIELYSGTREESVD